MSTPTRPDLEGVGLNYENMTRDEPRKATPKPRPTKPFPDAERLDETDKVEMIVTTIDGRPLYKKDEGKIPPKTEDES